MKLFTRTRSTTILAAAFSSSSSSSSLLLHAIIVTGIRRGGRSSSESHLCNSRYCSGFIVGSSSTSSSSTCSITNNHTPPQRPHFRKSIIDSFMTSHPTKKRCIHSTSTSTTPTNNGISTTTTTSLSLSSSSYNNNINTTTTTMKNNHNNKDDIETINQSRKKWTICRKCLGEGKIPSRMTKKAKFQKKKLLLEQQQQQQQQQQLHQQLHQQMQPHKTKQLPAKVVMKNCNVCSGTGLIRTSSSTSTTSSTTSTSHTKTNNNNQLHQPKKGIKPIPIHPNVHVGIVGGGIGGLALALALQHRSIPYTIYEKDLNFDERKQGYGLTMQQGSQALLALGLFDDDNNDNEEDHENMDKSTPTNTTNTTTTNTNTNTTTSNVNPKLLFGKGIHSKRHIVHEPNGTIVGEWGLKVWGRPKSKQNRDAKRQNAHIQRQELRRIFYDQIENKEERIKWGHKLVSYGDISNNNIHSTGFFHDDSDNDDYDDNDVNNGVGDEQNYHHALRNADCNKRISMTFQVRNDINKGENNDLEPSGSNCGLIKYSSTILVGADGIRSAVRKQKIGEENTPLRYLGCIVVLGITSSPQSSTLTSDGETVFQTADGTTRMYAMPFARKGHETADAAKYIQQKSKNYPEGKNSTIYTKKGLGETMWQLSFPMSEDDAKTLSSKGSNALKEEAFRRCGEWHDPIPEMLRMTPDELVSGYPVYDRGDILSDDLFRYGFNTDNKNDDLIETDRRVTMIGDAGHPMSPFKGQGANQAILDAIQLARALHKVFRLENPRGALEESLSEFESIMLKRSATKVKASAEAARFLHSDIAIMKGNITRAAAAAAQQNQDRSCT